MLALILIGRREGEGRIGKGARVVGATSVCVLMLTALPTMDVLGKAFFVPPLSAMTLFLLSFAGALIETEFEVAHAIAPWLAMTGILLNGITLLGYIYDATPLYGGGTGAVGIFAAATSVLLGAGFLAAAGFGRMPLRLLRGRSISAQLLRALLPATCVAMLLGELASDWFRGATGRQLAAQDALQTVFATVFITVVVLILTRRVGKRLDESEQRRARAEEELGLANRSLAEKVQERTAELELANRELRLGIVRHRETESALRESEAKNNALLAALPDWIFLLEADGTVLDARAPREVNGLRQWSESIAAELSAKVAELVRQHPQMRAHDTFDFTLPMEDATFEARFVRRAHGEMLAVVRDISELARLEREVLEANVREQKRIGEELHDGIGQQLTAVAFMSKLLELELSEQNLPQAPQAAEIGRQVSASIATLRTLARGLFRYELGTGSLLGALQDLASAADTSYRVECTLEADRSILLPDRTADLHLYRISQEAITNAVQHGGARKIRLQLMRQAGQIIFRVEDDGNGAPVAPESCGVGLRTMEFRTRRLGGRFTIESRPGKGTSVICTLPDACPPPERECPKQLTLFP